MYDRKRFPHLYRECTRSSLQSMWDLTIHPLRGPTSSLALVPLSNQCEISIVKMRLVIGTRSSLQISIVKTRLGRNPQQAISSLLGFPSRFLNRVCQGKVSTPLYALVPLSNQCGISIVKMRLGRNPQQAISSFLGFSPQGF